jgi:hypothetical protein
MSFTTPTKKITDNETITENDICLRCITCSNNHRTEDCPVVCSCGCGRKEEYCCSQNPINHLSIPPPFQPEMK